MGQDPDLHTGKRRASSTGLMGPVVPDWRRSGSTGAIPVVPLRCGRDTRSFWASAVVAPVVPGVSGSTRWQVAVVPAAESSCFSSFFFFMPPSCRFSLLVHLGYPPVYMYSS